MRLNKNDISLYQNEYSIYVGDIESEETVYLDDKFMIIGNISTKKGIIATEHFIIIGDIESKSIYADKDFLCVGDVNCTNLQNYGEYKVINRKSKSIVDVDKILKENNISSKQLEKDDENIKNEDDEYINVIHNNDIKEIEEYIYTTLEKNKYDIEKIKVVSISKEEGNLYRIILDSPFHDQNNIKIITNKVQLNYKDKKIYIEVLEERSNADDEYSMINIGDYIVHKKYGKGKIISRYDDLFTVEFEDCEKDMKGEWIIDSKLIKKEL